MDNSLGETRTQDTALRSPVAQWSKDCSCYAGGFAELRSLNEHLKKYHCVSSPKCRDRKIDRNKMEEFTQMTRACSGSVADKYKKLCSLFCPDEASGKYPIMYAHTISQTIETADALSRPGLRLCPVAEQLFSASVAQEYGEVRREEREHEMQTHWALVSRLFKLMLAFPALEVVEPSGVAATAGSPDPAIEQDSDSSDLIALAKPLESEPATETNDAIFFDQFVDLDRD